MGEKFSPLQQILRIQEEQLELDKLKKEWRIMGKLVKSKSQKIPQMIRDLKLN